MINKKNSIKISKIRRFKKKLLFDNLSIVHSAMFELITSISLVSIDIFFRDRDPLTHATCERTSSKDTLDLT